MKADATESEKEEEVEYKPSGGAWWGWEREHYGEGGVEEVHRSNPTRGAQINRLPRAEPHMTANGLWQNVIQHNQRGLNAQRDE